MPRYSHDLGSLGADGKLWEQVKNEWLYLCMGGKMFVVPCTEDPIRPQTS